MFIGVICSIMCSHAFACRLVVFYLTREAMFWTYFPFIFKDLSKTMVRVLYIVCVFTITCIQLPYLQCIPRGVHRVRMSSFCVKYTVCFHVLIHELVIRVSFFTDTGAIPCISTSCSIARGVIHEIGWKKFKRPGHVYMILGMHCSSL